MNIKVGTRLKAADSSGAGIVECIKIYKSATTAKVGDVILVSVKTIYTGSKIKKKTMHKALIVRTRAALSRSNGSVLNFSDNAVVMLDAENNPVGKKIAGPIPLEIRQKGYAKIMSFAKFVV